MMPAGTIEHKFDRIELLDKALNQAWHALCSSCDVTAGLPELTSLFCGADLTIPRQAADTVMANMVLDIMENVSRFSPYYRMPARAFGLVSIRDRQTNELHWNLAPEISQKYCDLLEELAIAIRKNSTLIQASLIVEGRLSNKENCITIVTCECKPPRKLQISRKDLGQADIICDACRHPFA